ncbi:methyltransferase 11 domain-containing protein [Citrus sinensis]|uniref:Methyltransferase 11 domain-containing protein n=1 Tax=Citrus sinensis TaxID=2711 RepID=A0ACB8IAP4_CITSI|nr:methyltransferase 11 domain-containing protein [Citrus sinensis]
MTMGTTTQAYGEPWYWDNRYAHESGPFDWYQKYPSLAPLIKLYVPSHHQRILIVGCGNSGTSLSLSSLTRAYLMYHQQRPFSEGMVDDGYEDVVNVDISSVVIEAMMKKYSNRPQLKYIKMDVRQMDEFQTGSFDSVVDKGTLDSLLCGSNSRQNATQMLKEVWSFACMLLTKLHQLLQVTYGAPIYRLGMLRDSCSWNIKLHVIEKLVVEEKSGHPIWELTNPVPLENDGRSVEELLGKNPDVHYIYVCTKVGTWQLNHFKLKVLCMSETVFDKFLIW